jgi:hypothetical protein
MEDRGFFLTCRAIRRQLAGMPSELYLIRLIHHQTRRAVPGERLWTAGQLVSPATVRFLRARNRQGCDVYVHPYAGRQNAGYILVDLDGAAPAVISTMRAHGHDPCVVVQSSPGHLQAWVQLSTNPLEPWLATAIGKHLARTYGGDLASTDWRHLGRLAGFTNQKPARRTPGGYAPWVKVLHASAGLASQANRLLELVRAMIPTSQSPRSHTDETVRSDAVAPLEQAAQHEIAAAEATEIYRDCIHRWRILDRFPQPDWSIVDLWVARHLLSQGMHPLRLRTILQLGSPWFPRAHSDPDDYLRRTLVRAGAFPFPRAHSLCETHAPTSTRRQTGSACSNSTGGR